MRKAALVMLLLSVAASVPVRAEETVVLESFDIDLPNPGHWVKVSTHPDAAACAAAMRSESEKYVRPENAQPGNERYWRCR